MTKSSAGEGRTRNDDDRPDRRHADPHSQRQRGVPRRRRDAVVEAEGSVAKILEREGYITGFEVDDQPGRPGRRLTIRMKYSSDRRRTISGLKRVSRPGLRVYSKADGVPRVLGGMGIADPVHEPGPADRPRSARAQGRRRSPLPGLVAELVMSRIGKQPITVPSGVDVTIDGATVAVKGPKGQLELDARRRRHGRPRRRRRCSSSAPTTSAQNRSLHGLQRTLIANMVIGVSDGFAKELEIVGVGYRATAQGPNRSSSRSASRTRCTSTPPTASPSRCRSPPASSCAGIDKQLVGQVAADIRKHPQARALQGQGHPLRRRACPAQSRQVGK